MPNLIPQFIRPVEPSFEALIDKYNKIGMHIVPVDGLGSPEQLKAIINITPEDFGVCAFMGSRPPKGMKGLSQVVRLYPKMLSQLDNHYELHMPRISGGGNWDKTSPKKTGLMGQWARGATEMGLPAHFITMQDLVQREGLPYAKGQTACLKQLPNEDRIGERTDGLICVADLFIVFPGGLGTLTELAALFTNTSINNEFGKKKVVIYDPIFTDPITGEQSRYWQNSIAAMTTQNHSGLIGNDTAKNINSHCVLYRPDELLTPEQITRELMSLTLSIRKIAPKSKSDAGFKAIHPAIRKKHLAPLSKGSLLKRIFNDHGTNGQWVDDLRRLVKPTENSAQLAL